MEDEDFFFMKELKKPALRSRVKVVSEPSSRRLLGDLSRCFRGNAGELPERPSPPSRDAIKPRERRQDGRQSQNGPHKISVFTDAFVSCDIFEKVNRMAAYQQ